jgi:hypothetical protein
MLGDSAASRRHKPQSSPVAVTVGSVPDEIHGELARACVVLPPRLGSNQILGSK